MLKLGPSSQEMTRLFQDVREINAWISSMETVNVYIEVPRSVKAKMLSVVEDTYAKLRLIHMEEFPKAKESKSSEVHQSLFSAGEKGEQFKDVASTFPPYFRYLMQIDKVSWNLIHHTGSHKACVDGLVTELQYRHQTVLEELRKIEKEKEVKDGLGKRILRLGKNSSAKIKDPTKIGNEGKETRHIGAAPEDSNVLVTVKKKTGVFKKLKSIRKTVKRHMPKF